MNPNHNSSTSESPGFSRFKHGLTTYRMAWCSEMALFILAMMLAVFNVMSVWNGGNRVQGFILAGGWFVIAVIELSIIPLAGALRICKWKDKWLALLGVAGLACLSAWTVYEFNEFASYYLTKPAREAVIQVQSKRQELTNLVAETENATHRHVVATNVTAQLTQQEASRLSALEDDYKSQAESRRAEHEARLASLRASLPVQKSSDPSSQEAIRLLQEKIRRIESDRDQQTAIARKSMEEAKASAAAATTSRQSALETQKAEAQKELSVLRSTMLKEMESVSGLLKESRKNQIRDRYQAQIDKVTGQMASIDTEIRQLHTARGPAQSNETDETWQRANESITSIQKQIDVLQASLERSGRVENEKRDREIARIQTQISEREQEYQALVEKERTKHDRETQETKRLTQEQRERLMESSLSGAALQSLLTKTHAESKRLEAEITAITVETDSRMEPVLYYRIAKWFHQGPGLPTKDDYLQAQLYIFAPAGIFLSLVAIALAYIGTGLRNDHTDGEHSPRQVESLAKELRAREEKNDKLQMQLRSFAGEVDKLNREIIAGKINMSWAVARIPQTIVVSGRTTGPNGHPSKKGASNISKPINGNSNGSNGYHERGEAITAE